MSRKTDQTRARVLEAITSMVEEGLVDASMSAIASRAGVSRQTLYLHFESRGALLLAMVEDSDEQRGLGPLLASVSDAPTPREALVASVRVTAAYAPRIHRIAMALDRNRHADPELQAAWDDRMGQRRRGLIALLDPLSEQDCLSPQWTVAQAADILLHAGSPRTYSDLVESGWTDADYERYLVRLVDFLLD